MSRNLLAETTSPYLLQHKDNPVQWRAWGPDALQEARKYDKPILLSIGYAACHWCHVMAHESFEDEETAALMNELYVNIKVDREERPDIDAIYMNALMLLGQQGGWPLTMFLTPDGEPFWGGTYFPREPRHGMPAFRDVLREVHRVYHAEPEKIGKNRQAITAALKDMSEAARPGEIRPEMLDEVADRIAGLIDTVHGGIRGAPKFPQPFLIELVWRGFLRTGDKALKAAVTTTLDRMCQGGIYDHLGGGFSRYSVDEEWLVPHFEKMLYDNAQLIDLLTLVWQYDHQPLYAYRVHETVAWSLREMVAEGGSFAATLDADLDGEEGKFYVWTEAEIDAALDPDDTAFFKEIYNVLPDGNWEDGKNILNRRKAPDLLSEREERRLAACRDTLLRQRESRIRPGWDDKVLADWNGLMIHALVNAAAVFNRNDWFEPAAKAFNFVTESMMVEGRLRHAWRRGRRSDNETLDDYAMMARAAITLYELTGASDYLDWAEHWVGVLNDHYWDATNGGYFLTPDDAEALIARTRTVNDNAMPSGNGVMVGVLARLYHLTGKDPYRERADTLVRAFAGEMQRNFFPLATYLNNFELLQRAVQVAVIGDRTVKGTQRLVQAAYGPSQPNRVVTVIGPGADLPPGHPAHGKEQVDDNPTAYVCVGSTCSLPFTDAGKLADAVASPLGSIQTAAAR